MIISTITDNTTFSAACSIYRKQPAMPHAPNAPQIPPEDPFQVPSESDDTDSDLDLDGKGPRPFPLDSDDDSDDELDLTPEELILHHCV